MNEETRYQYLARKRRESKITQLALSKLLRCSRAGVSSREISQDLTINEMNSLEDLLPGFTLLEYISLPREATP